MHSPRSHMARQAHQPLLSPEELQALLFSPWATEPSDDQDDLAVVDTRQPIAASVVDAFPVCLIRA